MPFRLNCRDVGVECEFETYGETIEEVVEHCADHGRREHGLTSFTPDLYAKMRQHVQIIDASTLASRLERHDP